MTDYTAIIDSTRQTMRLPMIFSHYIHFLVFRCSFLNFHYGVCYQFSRLTLAVIEYGVTIIVELTSLSLTSSDLLLLKIDQQANIMNNNIRTRYFQLDTRMNQDSKQ